MTTNQLIALLETHRTGTPVRTGLETIGEDLRHLIQWKLIERATTRGDGVRIPSHIGDVWTPTGRGVCLIESLLFYCKGLSQQ